ncbi:hypothetical protein SAHL_17385 [Salinisphaera orenii YIM 95161]|uniref:Uncharacterized protein n=1 Tax=Salinisphaera orenii YIM 95161 TaxID=1051139 RepID=A0A423PD90_9GAMM|nr:hypothetical protein SAHL_17385 [Salinisphaera halophila YIM 95161]
MNLGLIGEFFKYESEGSVRQAGNHEIGTLFHWYAASFAERTNFCLCKSL